MKKKNGLIKSSLACALIFGGVGLLAGCDKEEPGVTISNISLTGDFANSVKEFAVGSEVSLAGATFEVSFSNGTTQTITVTDEMWVKADYDFTTLGEKEIIVKFKVNGEEKSKTIIIKMINPSSVQSVIDDIVVLSNSSPHTKDLEYMVDEIKVNYLALNATEKALVTNYSAFFTAYKNIKKDVITNYVSVEDYQESDRATIASYIENAETDVDSATTIDAVDTALETAKSAINAIDTTLEIKINVVLEAFDTYVEETFEEEDYSPLKWLALQTAISTVRNEIATANNIDLLPDVTEGYFNSNFMEIDTIVTENFKNRVAELPDSTDITTYDATLMAEVKSILNTYESVLTNEEKNRISSELIDEVEAVEFALGTIDLDSYKVSKIAIINQFLEKESEYGESEWETISELINNAISNINSYTYSENAKTYVDSAYTSLMDSIYDVATNEVKELNSKINVSLPNNYYYVNSNKVVFGGGETYNVYNNKVKIGDELYTISDTTISDGENTYELVDGKFTIDTTTYTLIDLETNISDLKALFNELSEEEKEHYKALEVKLLIEKYENVVASKAEYLDTIVEQLNEYLDEETYNPNRLEEIQATIDSFIYNYSNVQSWTLEQYQTGLSSHYETTIESILTVKDKLADLKDSIEDELTYDYNNYYEDECEEIEEIIADAIEVASAIEKEENESMAQALARVQEIIDAAKEDIDEVKTLFEIHSQEVIKLKTELKEYIDIDNYTDLESLDELDAELSETSPDIVKAYKNALSALDEAINEDTSLEYLQETYENVKESIIDRVNRTYSVTLNLSTLNDKVESVRNNSYDELSSDYYVEIGDIRTLINNGHLTSGAYYHDNNLANASIITTNNEYKYLTDYKVENGKLYLSLPYLLFNGPSIDFKVSFYDISTKDTYSITIDGLTTASDSISSTNVYATDYGEEVDESTGIDNVGYNSTSTTLYSYREDSKLNFEYKNGENFVTGTTIIKWVSQNGTYYSFVNLEENGVSSIYINGFNASGWAIENSSIIKNFKVSIYNENSGVDLEDLKFSYIEYVNLEGAIDKYSDLMSYQINQKPFLPAAKESAEQIANEFRAKFIQATDDDQLATLWESTGVVGYYNNSDSIITIEGNKYTISEGKLLWYGVEVGDYISTYASEVAPLVNLNNISLTIDEGFVFLGEQKIGVYGESQDVKYIRLYENIGDENPSISLEYVIKGESLTRRYEDYLEETVGSVSLDGDAITGITITAKQYIVNYTAVIDENKIGFINRLEEIETIADPVIYVNGQELTLDSSKANVDFGGTYEYEIKLTDNTATLEGSIDGDLVLKFNYGQDLPVDLRGYGEGTLYVEIYNSESQCLRRYELILSKESAFNSIKLNNEIMDSKGEVIEKNLSPTNKLTIDIKDGYEYQVYLNGRSIDDLDNLDLELGRNEISINSFPSGQDEGHAVDYFHFFVNYGTSEFESITFNGINMSTNGTVVVYDEEMASEVEVISSLNTITNIDVLDEYGNSVLTEGKIDMTGMPFMKVSIKMTVSGYDYYINDMTIINMSEEDYCIGEIYRDHENVPGLNNYIDIKYDESIILMQEESALMLDGQFGYVKVIAPKDYDVNKISAEINSEWVGEETITLTRCGETNIYKLVVKDSEGIVDTITYFVLEEGKHSIDNDAGVVSGALAFEEFMQLQNSGVSSEEEAIEILQDKILTFTQETITSEDDYYQEGVDEYYSATIKARMGDLFFMMPNNSFVSDFTINAEFLMNMGDDVPLYFFFGEFETGDIIIVDVTSSDGTKTVRYIYNIEKQAPDLGAQIIIGEGNDAIHTNEADFIIDMGMMTEGTMFGDFIAIDDEQFVAYIGEHEFTDADKITLKLNISEAIKAMGNISLDGNSEHLLTEDDLKGVEVTPVLMEVEPGVSIPTVTFYVHRTGEEGIISYTLIFMDYQNPME